MIDYFVLSPYGKKNGLLMTLLWKKALIIRRNTSYFVGVFSELIFYFLIVRTQNSDYLRFSGKIKRAPQTDPTNSYLVRILFTGLLMVLCQIQLFNKHLSEALKS